MPLLIIAIGILLQVWLTSKKITPFLSLLIVAILIGLTLGMDTASLVSSIEKGVGSTLGGLALILCLGAVLGKILEKSGAIQEISNALIKGLGKQHVQWAVLITGFLVGLPLYYNAGFVILIPLVFSVARTANVPLVFVAIPMAAALSATHCFLPPHPGPVVLVDSLDADLGLTLLYGLILVLPLSIISGPALAWFFRKGHFNENSTGTKTEATNESIPSRGTSFIIALLPIVLMTLAVFIKMYFESGWLVDIMLFLGDPTIALLSSSLLAIYFLGVKLGYATSQVMSWAAEGISGIAMILLIITSGGVLKQVLIDSGTGDYIIDVSKNWNINPLLFGWLVTALLRVTLGSATIAGLTAVGIVAPLVVATQASPELMVLSIGAGSIFGSHINDTGFWMFKEYIGLSLKETFLSWTVMESVMSVLGLFGVLVLDLFIK
ncbi:MAG: gluconate:H+ symporter [Cyclobacteriaceae bacterium]|nr:gluconate transporter [Cyclobacteriaceae bacterium]